MTRRRSAPAASGWLALAFLDDLVGTPAALLADQTWPAIRLVLLALTLGWVGLLGRPRLVSLHLLVSLATLTQIVLADSTADTIAAAVVAVAAALLGTAAIRRRWARSAGGLRTAAERDPLTGLLNRRGLDRWLRGLEPGTVTLLLLDIDGLHALNRTAGHAAGDAVLRSVATALAGDLRAGQQAGRWGGDELVLIARHPEAGVPPAMADRIHARAVAAARAVGGSVSAGAATGGFSAPSDLGALLDRADAALRAAKADGTGRLHAE